MRRSMFWQGSPANRSRTPRLIASIASRFIDSSSSRQKACTPPPLPITNDGGDGSAVSSARTGAALQALPSLGGSTSTSTKRAPRTSPFVALLVSPSRTRLTVQYRLRPWPFCSSAHDAAAAMSLPNQRKDSGPSGVIAARWMASPSDVARNDWMTSTSPRRAVVTRQQSPGCSSRRCSHARARLATGRPRRDDSGRAWPA